MPASLSTQVPGGGGGGARGGLTLPQGYGLLGPAGYGRRFPIRVPVSGWALGHYFLSHSMKLPTLKSMFAWISKSPQGKGPFKDQGSYLPRWTICEGKDTVTLETIYIHNLSGMVFLTSWFPSFYVFLNLLFSLSHFLALWFFFINIVV